MYPNTFIFMDRHGDLVEQTGLVVLERKILGVFRHRWMSVDFMNRTERPVYSNENDFIQVEIGMVWIPAIGPDNLCKRQKKKA